MVQGPNGPMKGRLSQQSHWLFLHAWNQRSPRPFNRIDISTHDRLDLGNEVRGCYKSVMASCGKAACPPLPVK